MLLDECYETFGGMWVEVAIDDCIFFFALENRSDREN
jgi:hypothetical protein